MFTDSDVAIFEKTEPPNNMTPLPKKESKDLYPIISDSSSSESQIPEDEITSQNSQILENLSDSFDDKKWDNILNKNPRASMKLKRRLNNFQSSDDSMNVESDSDTNTIILPTVDKTVPLSEAIKLIKDKQLSSNDNDSINVSDTETIVLPNTDKTVPLPTLNTIQQSVIISNNNNDSINISDLTPTNTITLPSIDHTIPLNTLSKISTQLQQQQQSPSFDNNNNNTSECITMTLPVTDKTVPLKPFHQFVCNNNKDNILFTFNKPQTPIPNIVNNNNFTINTISPIVPNTENRISPTMDILADTFDDNSSTINTNTITSNKEEESPIKPINIRESIVQSNLIKKNGLICLDNNDNEINKFQYNIDNFVDELLITKDINKIQKPLQDNNILKRKADVLLSSSVINNNTTTLLPTLQQQQQQPTTITQDNNDGEIEKQLHILKKKKLSVMPTTNIDIIKPIESAIIKPLSSIKKRLSIYSQSNNNNTSTVVNKTLTTANATATVTSSVVNIIPSLPITDYSYLNISSSTSSEVSNKSNNNNDSLPSVETITPTTTLSPIDQSYHSRNEIINTTDNNNDLEIEEEEEDDDESSNISIHSNSSESQYNSVIKIIEQPQSQQSSSLISSNEILTNNNNNNNDKSLSILHNESVISSIPYRTSSSTTTTTSSSNHSFAVCDSDDNNIMNMPSISIKISQLEIDLTKYASEWINESDNCDVIDLKYYHCIKNASNKDKKKRIKHYTEMIIKNTNEENVNDSSVEIKTCIFPIYGYYYDLANKYGVYDICSKIKTVKDFFDNVEELNKRIHQCEESLQSEVNRMFGI